MADADPVKTARELLDALPGWRTWKPDGLFSVVIAGRRVHLAHEAEERPSLPVVKIDAYDVLDECELPGIATSLAALPRTTAALVEEVERLRAETEELRGGREP